MASADMGDSPKPQATLQGVMTSMLLSEAEPLYSATVSTFCCRVASGCGVRVTFAAAAEATSGLAAVV